MKIIGAGGKRCGTGRRVYEGRGRFGKVRGVRGRYLRGGVY